MNDPDDFFARTGIRLAAPDSLDTSAITNQVSLEWRAPRFGQHNPERMTNPLWEWLARTGINAYQAAQRFNWPSTFDAGPGWCFDRFGQSMTLLPDGRRVFIAGEHEDHYDPDFYIYNDVLVWQPDGRIEILGYPRDVFPPTDFHTATLWGDKIIIVGNLGYLEQRRQGVTQVALLETQDWSMRMVECQGEQPQWLHKHRAVWSEHGRALRLSNGQTDPMTEGARLRENFDLWELDVLSWTWRRTWKCDWAILEIHREDNEPLGLWEISQAFSPCFLDIADKSLLNDLGLTDDVRETLQSHDSSLQQQRQRLAENGITKAQFESLHSPPLKHEPVAEASSDEIPFNEKRIRVDGVIVRYVDDVSVLRVVVMGDLSPEKVAELAEDCRSKLESIQGIACVISQIE